MRLLGRRDRLAALPEITVLDLRPDAVPAEMFRTLRTNIQFSFVDKERASLLVTSPMAEEGKSLVSSHLAVAFARAGKRVFVVDADFRHPSIHEYYRQRNDVGLAEVLLGEVKLGDALKKVQVDRGEMQTSLYLLPSGRRPPNPAELLGSRRMHTTLAALKEAAELVVVDAPPIVPVTDAGILAPATDGAVIVAASGVTRRNALQRAVDLLGKSGANVLGVVLNFVPPSDGYGYYYAYPYAGEAPAGDAR